MSRIESLVDLVKEIERHWITLLNREDESQCDHGFLPSRELRHFARFSRLAGEGNFDQDS